MCSLVSFSSSSYFYLSLTVMHFWNDIQTFFINWEILALIYGNCKSTSRILMNLSSNFKTDIFQEFCLNLLWLDHVDNNLKSDVIITDIYQIFDDISDCHSFGEICLLKFKSTVVAGGKEPIRDRRNAGWTFVLFCSVFSGRVVVLKN